MGGGDLCWCPQFGEAWKPISSLPGFIPAPAAPGPPPLPPPIPPPQPIAPANPPSASEESGGTQSPLAKIAGNYRRAELFPTTLRLQLSRGGPSPAWREPLDIPLVKLARIHARQGGGGKICFLHFEEIDKPFSGGFFRACWSRRTLTFKADRMMEFTEFKRRVEEQAVSCRLSTLRVGLKATVAPIDPASGIRDEAMPRATPSSVKAATSNTPKPGHVLAGLGCLSTILILLIVAIAAMFQGNSADLTIGQGSTVYATTNIAVFQEQVDAEIDFIQRQTNLNESKFEELGMLLQSGAITERQFNSQQKALLNQENAAINQFRLDYMMSLVQKEAAFPLKPGTRCHILAYYTTDDSTGEIIDAKNATHAYYAKATITDGNNQDQTVYITADNMSKIGQ